MRLRPRRVDGGEDLPIKCYLNRPNDEAANGGGLMRLYSLFGLLGPFNEVNKLVYQYSQIALERQIGALLRCSPKLNGKPL